MQKVAQPPACSRLRGAACANALGRECLFCPARLIIQLKLSVEAKSSFIFVLEKGRPHLRRAHLPAGAILSAVAFCRRARRAQN